MFHFGKKKASVPELVLSAENIELYRGPLSDIPLSEKTILATCMDLYKDPQPCYIHRGAARQYLVAKLTDMITMARLILLCLKNIPALNLLIMQSLQKTDIIPAAGAIVCGRH